LVPQTEAAGTAGGSAAAAGLRAPGPAVAGAAQPKSEDAARAHPPAAARPEVEGQVAEQGQAAVEGRAAETDSTARRADADSTAGRAGADSTAGDSTAGRAGADSTARRADAGLGFLPAMLAAVAGGLALVGAFPPVGFWPLAAVGPALLVVALWRRNLRGSFLVGLGFGLAFFVPLLSWLANVAWYAWAALAIAEAVIFAIFAVGQRLMLRLPAWPVAVACWWVAVEAVRDRWPYAFPWGRLAMSQAQAPTVRWVAVGGPPLLSFLMALAGATLAWLLLGPPLVAAGGSSRTPAPARGGAAALRRRAVPALAFAAAAGLAVAGSALPAGGTPSRAPTAEVAAVQGNVPRGGTLEKLLRETTVTANHVAATEQLAAQVRAGSRPAPDLVIWPENSTDIDPSLDPFVYASIAEAVDAINRPLLVGAVLQNPLRNTGQLWLPGRGPVAIYVKRQLVPFGEYIPFRGLLDKFTSLPSLQPVNFTAGHRAVVFRIGKIKLGDVICYEVGFDNLVSSEVSAGANLLTEQTNDADFELDGQLGETLQQLAMARIRAIEFDRAMVVVGTTGVSAIIAPDGTLIAHTRTWQRAVPEARIPLISSTTLAERLGEWPEIMLSALAGAALAWGIAGAVTQGLQKRRARPGDPHFHDQQVR
jgi:apolipoprotein N-acyltransferase